MTLISEDQLHFVSKEGELENNASKSLTTL